MLLKVPGILHVVLCLGNPREHLPILQIPGVSHVLEDLPDDASCIVLIVDRKVRVISDAVDEPSKDPDAHRVERRDPDALRAEPDEGIDTASHLSRGLVRERDREDVPGVHVALLHEIGDAVGDDSCLAASCSRKDQHGSFGLKAGLLLFLVQRVVNTQLFSISPSSADVPQTAS